MDLGVLGGLDESRDAMLARPGSSRGHVKCGRSLAKPLRLTHMHLEYHQGSTSTYIDSIGYTCLAEDACARASWN